MPRKNHQTSVWHPYPWDYEIRANCSLITTKRYISELTRPPPIWYTCTCKICIHQIYYQYLDSATLSVCDSYAKQLIGFGTNSKNRIWWTLKLAIYMVLKNSHNHNNYTETNISFPCSHFSNFLNEASITVNYSAACATTRQSVGQLYPCLIALAILKLTPTPSSISCTVIA